MFDGVTQNSHPQMFEFISKYPFLLSSHLLCYAETLDLIHISNNNSHSAQVCHTPVCTHDFLVHPLQLPSISITDICG